MALLTLSLLVLGRVELVKLPKLVVLPLIDQVLTVDFSELVVVAKYFNFIRDEGLISIVVPLHHESVNKAEVFAT